MAPRAGQLAQRRRRGLWWDMRGGRCGVRGWQQAGLSQRGFGDFKELDETQQLKPALQRGNADPEQDHQWDLL